MSIVENTLLYLNHKELLEVDVIAYAINQERIVQKIFLQYKPVFISDYYVDLVLINLLPSRPPPSFSASESSPTSPGKIADYRDEN